MSKGGGPFNFWSNYHNSPTFEPKVGERYRHTKRGTVYTVENVNVRIQASEYDGVDGARGVLYKSEADGDYTIRPVTEFTDGRFVKLDERSSSNTSVG